MAINQTNIMRETGLSPSQIRSLKSEARENLNNDSGSMTDKGVAKVQDMIVERVADGVVVNVTGKGGGTITVGIDGVAQVEYGVDGSGSIDILGLYEIEVYKKDCFYVKSYSIAGMLAFQEIELDPDCEQPEPEDHSMDSNLEVDLEFNSDDVPKDEQSWEDLGFGDDWKPRGHPKATIIVHYVVNKFKDEYIDFATNKQIDWREWRELRYKYQGIKDILYFYYQDIGMHDIPAQITMNVTNLEKGLIIDYRDWGQTEHKRTEIENPVGSIYASRYYGPVSGAAKAVLYKRYIQSAKDYPKVNSYAVKFKDGHREVSDRGSNNDYTLQPYARKVYAKYADQVIWEGIIDPYVKNHPGGSPPQKKPRKMDCCQDLIKLKKMVKRIHDVLDAEELEQKKFTVPNRLIAPNGKGTQELKTYLEIAQWQMRMQDHLGIHPFKVSLTDANAAKAGNQKVEAQFVSGTAGMRKTIELLLENKGDAAARLNLQVRSAIALAQILQVVTIISKSISSLISFVGMPFQEKVSVIKMPFDISLGSRKSNKGFDPKVAKDNASKEIQVNEEAATEEILPEFLNSSDHPYVHPKFDGKFLSLIELIKGVSRNG